MIRGLSLLVAIGIVAGSGALHGLWTDRWRVSPELEAPAAKLAEVARILGPWEAQAKKDITIPSQDLARGGILGYLARNYVNRDTKKQVQVFVVCGRPGLISVHTPDACFAGAGFEMAGSPTKYPSSDQGPVAADSFWCAQFTKEGVDASASFRVFWAWSADGRWQAPSNPRLAFAGYPALFKLYVIHPSPDKREPADKDPALDLMKRLIPELQRCLFPET